MSGSVKLRAALLAILAVQIAVSLLAHQSYRLTAFGDVTTTLLMVWATLAMLFNVRSATRSTRAFWLLMTSGFALWTIANFSWGWVEVIQKREVPNPFAADVVLFIHIVPLVAALLLQPHRGSAKPKFSRLDLLLLAVWWLYLYLIIVIPWQYVHLDLERYGFSFNLIYLVETATLVVTAGVFWQRTSQPWRTLYGHLFGAALLYMLSSQLASLAIDRDRYYTGSIYDIPLVASILWFVWIGSSASALHLAPESRDEPEAVLTWPSLLAMVAALSTPIIAIWIVAATDVTANVRYFRLIVTLVAIVIMSAILFVRQALLDRRLVHLLHDSHESLVQLREVQSQLVQSEKLASLGKLVAGAAHEINNPLAAISGYAELLREKGPEVSSLAQKIVEQCRRTKTLVSDLLMFAQEHRSAKSRVEIEAVLGSALKLKEPELEARNVRLVLDGPRQLPAVEGDANQLLGVFLRIIANAADALQSNGGTLTVRTAIEEPSVVIEFQDDGPGVKEPARIFDPFYTTKPVGQGAGLGLSVCYGVIKAHRGQIFCRNNPQGGATFRILIPALEVAAAAAT